MAEKTDSAVKDEDRDRRAPFNRFRKLPERIRPQDMMATQQT